MSEQKDMILENFLSSAIRTLDTDEIYNILMDSLILLLHLKDTSNTLFFIFCCIENVRTCCHATGVYTEECKFTYEWVSHDLEC